MCMCPWVVMNHWVCSVEHNDPPPYVTNLSNNTPRARSRHASQRTARAPPQPREAGADHTHRERSTQATRRESQGSLPPTQGRRTSTRATLAALRIRATAMAASSNNAHMSRFLAVAVRGGAFMDRRFHALRVGDRHNSNRTRAAASLVTSDTPLALCAQPTWDSAACGCYDVILMFNLSSLWGLADVISTRDMMGHASTGGNMPRCHATSDCRCRVANDQHGLETMIHKLQRCASSNTTDFVKSNFGMLNTELSFIWSNQVHAAFQSSIFGVAYVHVPGVNSTFRRQQACQISHRFNVSANRLDIHPRADAPLSRSAACHGKDDSGFGGKRTLFLSRAGYFARTRWSVDHCAVRGDV